MKELFEKHYSLICERGLISHYTTVDQFVAKIAEELSEVIECYSDDIRTGSVPSSEFIQESIDLMMVIVNMIQHLELNLENEISLNVNKQKKRVCIDSK